MFETNDAPDFDVFTDLLFNSLVAFAFMFFIAFTMINPIAETGEIETDVEMMITTNWPNGNPDDVDTYVEDPSGNIVWYNAPEAGLMNLDRDDRGEYKDVMIVDGEEVSSDLNQEIVSIRGLQDGEYVVNVVHYLANSTDPVPVDVTVQKMNPRVSVVYHGETMLTGTGDEKTMVRFTLEDGDVVDVNTRDKSLVELTRSNRSQPEAPPERMDPGTGEAL